MTEATPAPHAPAMPSSSKWHNPVQPAPPPLLDEVRIYSWRRLPWKMSLWSWYLPEIMSLSSQYLAQHKIPAVRDTHQALEALMTCQVLLVQGTVIPTIISAKQKMHIHPLKAMNLIPKSLIKYKGLDLVTSIEAVLFPDPERKVQTKRT